MSKAILLKGHTLIGEGRVLGMTYYCHSVVGEGIGGCSCGARSPVLPSGAARKRWHREHKAEVIAKAEQRQRGEVQND